MITSSTTVPYLLAELAGVRLAVPVGSVVEIVRSVELAVVPGAPDTVEGALNLRGTLVPVVDLRVRLGLPMRSNDPSDNLIVFSIEQRLMAIRVESVDDVENIDPSDVKTASAISPAFASVEGLSGIAARDDGMLVMFDPARFLTDAEMQGLDVLLRERT